VCARLLANRLQRPGVGSVGGMLHLLLHRLAFLRGVIRPLWVRVAVPAWGIVAFYDTLSSQLFTEWLTKHAPKLREIITMTSSFLPVWGWLLILAAILVIASFEYAYRQHMRTEAIVPNIAGWLSPHHAAKRFCDGDDDLLSQKLARGELLAKGMLKTSPDDVRPEQIIPPALWRTLYLTFDGEARAPAAILLALSSANPLHKGRRAARPPTQARPAWRARTLPRMCRA
jgi:hypothetical protein